MNESIMAALGDRVQLGRTVAMNESDGAVGSIASYSCELITGDSELLSLRSADGYIIQFNYRKKLPVRMLTFLPAYAW